MGIYMDGILVLAFAFAVYENTACINLHLNFHSICFNLGINLLISNVIVIKYCSHFQVLILGLVLVQNTCGWHLLSCAFLCFCLLFNGFQTNLREIISLTVMVCMFICNIHTCSKCKHKPR